MNNGMRVFFNLVSSGNMPRSGIAGSYGAFIPSFSRNLHTIFHSGCISLHCHQQCKSIPFSSTPSSAFIVCWLFDDGHSDQCKMIPHCDFDLHFSNNVEHLSMCLLAICMFSVEKCLGLLPTFWLGCLFFWHWAPYIFWRLSLCQFFHLLLLSPILRTVLEKQSLSSNNSWREWWPQQHWWKPECSKMGC